MTAVITPGLAPESSEGPSVRAMCPSDLPAVRSMLARCSPGTLFHRFHGHGGGGSYVDRLFDNSDDLLVVADSGSCVGFAVLAGDDKLGVLVEDSWQRRGVGSSLVASIATRARQVGRTTIKVEVLSEDAIYLQLLGRLGLLQVQQIDNVISAEILIDYPAPRDPATAGVRPAE